MRRCFSRQSRADGFTLIELLVVVAIIALLISILLPALSKAKAQARQLVCNTHLKEQGNAAHLYGEDNGGWVARGFTDPAHFSYELMVLKMLKPSGTVLFPTDKKYATLSGKQWDGNVSNLWIEVSPENWPLQYICGAQPILQCPDFPVPTQKLE